MQGKKQLSNLRKGYCKTPNRIFKLGLSSNTIFLFIFLTRFSEEFNPSIGFLRKHMGWSKVTIYKHLKLLIEANIVTMIHEAGTVKLFALYKFNNPDTWKSQL